MPIKNYSTSVNVNKSVSTIMKKLVDAGARSVSVEYGKDGVAEGMTFELEIVPRVWRSIAMPVRIEGVHMALTRQKVEPRFRSMKHSASVAWKIADDWLSAQLALIEAQMTTLPEVMFPYLVIGEAEFGHRQTAYQGYVQSTVRELES